ncbi:MAG TPA: glutamate-1-semialdehyde-2,1-aminomutase [Firmicutes bacterium]|nr:glutamate-1-semialdehyde-2,1-aminomutase [Bacillota bacterium]
MSYNLAKSQALFAEAKQYIPGGVNSPVRSFRSVGGNPPFIARAQGSRIYDVDGHTYIDYVLSWGPMLLGHAHPEVLAALADALPRGTSYGAPTVLETEMAKAILELLPGMDMVRMVNSGTEATMSALRLARGYTKRNKIVKMAGGYHGHGDSLLVKAGSGVATLGLPDSPGVPAEIALNTITVAYNNLAELIEVFGKYGEDIAAVIVEPVPGNMGVIIPQPGYLQGLRSITAQYGALLIFDEVMSGFRLPRGFAQNYYEVTPDITCLGKVIGGGLPVGAYAGKREIMELIAPAGPVYQAGTLSGNPLAMAAGLATLRLLAAETDVYEKLADRTARLCGSLRAVSAAEGVKLWINQVGSMFTMFFTGTKVLDYETAKSCDTVKYEVFFRTMLAEGVYLAPSQFEAAFLSLSHTERDFEATVAAAAKAFKKVKDICER